MPVTSTSELTRLILAPNPGPMTLEGTNTYLVSAEPGRAVVVDPGPADPGHLQKIVEAAGTVELILISHRHHDHSESIDALHGLTGAPVAAALEVHSRDHDSLVGGELLEAAGVEITAVATPGHTSDSLSFWIAADGPHGSMLTGDTILGGSTTVIDHPDGTLADYLATLERYRRFGPALVLPAHGAPIAALDAEAQRLTDHRWARLRQVAAALSELGLSPVETSPDEVVDAVYADAPERVRRAARLSVQAQLEYLRTHSVTQG